MTFTALVVDDEEEIGREVEEAIGLIGGSAVSYSCAETCLEYLDKSGHGFDVIIADLAMPAMSGLDFLQRACQILDTSPRCFLMTGLPEFQGSEISDSKHFQLLSKPISLRVLKQKVRPP